MHVVSLPETANRRKSRAASASSMPLQSGYSYIILNFSLICNCCFRQIFPKSLVENVGIARKTGAFPILSHLREGILHNLCKRLRAGKSRRDFQQSGSFACVGKADFVVPSRKKREKFCENAGILCIFYTTLSHFLYFPLYFLDKERKKVLKKSCKTVTDVV